MRRSWVVVISNGNGATLELFVRIHRRDGLGAVHLTPELAFDQSTFTPAYFAFATR